jgi:hypothetical protein
MSGVISWINTLLTGNPAQAVTPANPLPTANYVAGAIVSATNPLPVFNQGGLYEAVAAGATNVALGPTGALGDRLDYLVCLPSTTAPGNVIIKDGANIVMTFTGGAGSVSNLIPFIIPVNALSVAGAWNITTGANITAYGVGRFT